MYVFLAEVVLCVLSSSVVCRVAAGGWRWAVGMVARV